ncbi:hypothetical protein Tco_1339015, partial [Tanacetum coccineum]
MKSAGKKNVPTFTKTSSAMPVGVEIVRSASSSIIRVLVKARRFSSHQIERGIRLMLAPRSTKAKHSFISGKSHGIRNLPWSPSFSFTGVFVNSIILSLSLRSFLNIGANLDMCRRASAKLSSKWRFRKISINFEARRSSFSWNFSLLALEGYGKFGLVFEATTGSPIWSLVWTTGGWMFSLLGCT